MTKRQYLNHALVQPHAWLKQCYNNPSKSMTPMHCKLILIAMRKKLGG